MSAQRRIEAFFALADRGLRTANILFDEDQLEDATLFVQQVAERVARALLTHAGVAFGTSHNLGQMADALPPGHPFKERLRGFDAFSTAGTVFLPPWLEAPPIALQAPSMCHVVMSTPSSTRTYRTSGRCRCAGG